MVVIEEKLILKHLLSLFLLHVPFYNITVTIGIANALEFTFLL